ncbi:hypothetical protein [Myceligenerans crystallogenes]|uniref:Secreted protein n=1 Tax=Myceligenerans crystallogenes TaxID=316335 RepID=A0ABN2N8X8_9MICO
MTFHPRSVRAARDLRRAGHPLVSLTVVALLAACGGGEVTGAQAPGAGATSAAPSDSAPASPTPSDDLSEPAPAEPPAPSDAASPSASPVPKPSAWGSVEIDAGHQPAWFEGSDWSCGMPAQLLDQSLDPAATLTAAGPLAPRPAGDQADGGVLLPVEIQVTGKKPTHTSPAVAVVVREGTVVSLPPLADGEPVEFSGTADAAVGSRNFCLPGGEAEGMTTYDQKLPDGAYEIRAFVELDPGASPRRFVLTEPVPAELKGGAWVAGA